MTAFLAKFVRVVMIDEYLTSQVCHECLLDKVPTREAAQLTFTKRVGKCSHPGHSPINRDYNAAKNIRAVFLELAKSGTRPPALARKAAED